MSRPNRAKCAIGMISVGDRPWAELTYPTVSAYAHRIGACPILLNSTPPEREFSLEPMPDWPGRRNKLAYGLKAYYPGKLLEDFEKVIIVDDTCVVALDTPNIFDIAISGKVAAVREPCHRGEVIRRREEDMMFSFIRKFTKITGADDCSQDRERNVNSGVVVYDRSSTIPLCSDNILEAQALLLSDYPHQTLMYYLLAKYEIPIQVLPSSFNNINIFIGDRSAADWTTTPLADAFIYHVTGWWRERYKLIDVLITRLRETGRL